MSVLVLRKVSKTVFPISVCVSLHGSCLKRSTVLKQVYRDFTWTLAVLVITIVPCFLTLNAGYLGNMFVGDDYISLILVTIGGCVAACCPYFLYRVLYGLSCLLLRQIVPCIGPVSVDKFYFVSNLIAISIELHLNTIRALAVLVIGVIPTLGYRNTCLLWSIAVLDIVAANFSGIPRYVVLCDGIGDFFAVIIILRQVLETVSPLPCLISFYVFILNRISVSQKVYRDFAWTCSILVICIIPCFFA